MATHLTTPKLRSLTKLLNNLSSISVTKWPPSQSKLLPPTQLINHNSNTGKSVTIMAMPLLQSSNKLLGYLSSVSVSKLLAPKPKILSKIIMHGNHHCHLRHPRV